MTWSREFIQVFVTQTTFQILHVITIFIFSLIVRKMGIRFLTTIFTLKIAKSSKGNEHAIKQKETIKFLLINIFKYVVNLISLVMIISVFIPIGTLMASVGAFALIITFGFQNMLADMVRGFFIIFEEMFLIGDFVEIATFKGEVIEIGLRTTKLKLASGETVLIPNNNIGNIVKLKKI